MKNISLGLKEELAKEATNFCICIRIVRRDGLSFGFTTWDQSFSYEFVTNPDSYGSIEYVPQNSFQPTDISSSSDLSVDNLEIVGIVSSAGLDANELSAGFYEGAEVTVFRVNPENLSLGEMIDKRGYIGEVTFNDDKYVCEILTSSSFLRRNVGQVSSPTCRVRRFCDNQCKLNEASFTHTGTAGVFGARAVETYFEADSVIGVSMSRLSSGVFRIDFNGFNLEREIKEVVHLGGVNYKVILRECFGIDIDGLDAVLVEGCDRKFSTCISLGNAINFRGEPHLPGTNAIIQSGRPPE